MEPRQRVLTALRRGVPDRVPKDLELSPAQLDALRQRTGVDDPALYFGLEVREVRPRTASNEADLMPYLGALPEGARVDEWGVAWVKGSMYHFEGMRHPLANITGPEDVQHYPLPDVADETLFDGFRERVQTWQRAGYAVAGRACALGGTVFWPAYKLRGMEPLLIDLLTEPEIATVLLDRVTALMTRLAAQIAAAGVDILWSADDFGTQRSLVMSLSTWQRWFKPRLAQVFRAAKEANRDVIIAFHSDGAISPLIPHLIEIGVDVLNPVQPECMDPAEIKKLYGDRLSFWGGVGTQTTLPFGTPDAVKETVRGLISTVGRDGGFLAAPTHVVEPDVPWENLVAFAEAVEEYGVY